jgi:phosphohistidine phosphatase
MTSRLLCLCQHGDALASEVDPDRPLSERGTADVNNMAAALSARVEIQTVIHSGKTRARQTAGIFHEKLAPEASIQSESGLAPNDDVGDFILRFGTRDTNLMVVSHLPFVGKLASRLLGQEERDILAFQPGAVAALIRGGNDEEWLLAWMLTPELLSN